MYCSNCGLNISKKMIDKALAQDTKHVNDIKYLAKSLLSTKKNAYKEEIKVIKYEDKENYTTRKVELLNKLNEEVKVINEKLAQNDLAYFQEVLHVNDKRSLNTLDYFVCPRCGKIVKPNLTEGESKALARAAHSEIHRGRNNISSGMCSLMIGLILAIIGFMFFALSFKATNGGVLDTSCVEFYVFIVLVVFGFGLIAYGAFNFFYGRNKINSYETLLKEMNNGAFHQ